MMACNPKAKDPQFPCATHLPWRGFAELVAQACGVPAVALARLDGKQIYCVDTVGMPPFSQIFSTAAQAAQALRRCAFPSDLPHASKEILSFADGSPAGALTLFSQTATESPLLSHFARHAEHLLHHSGWNAAAHASEALFRTIFDPSDLPLFFWDTENHLVDTNPAGVRLLGYTREECRSGLVTWRSVAPPPHGEALARIGQGVIEKESATTFEVEFLRACDHARVPVQVVSACLPGRNDRGVSFLLDMTPRRIAEREMQRAQAALQKRERSLRLAIEAGRLGTWDYSPTAKSIKWSRRCREIFGTGLHQLTTYPEFLRVVHPAHRDQVKQALKDLLSQRGQGHHEMEFRIIRKHDQIQRWVLARAQAFFGEIAGERTPSLLIGTLLDITERKHSEAELCRARDAAEAANAAKDQFIAKLSHELRTPLTPVLMGIDLLLKNEEFSPSLRQDITVMQHNIQIEARLIDDLLDVTRIVHGKLDLHLEEVDVHRLLDQAAGICAPQAAQQGVTVCFRLEACEYWIGGDPARLLQVLWNLLQNATKFTPPGGVVVITTSNPAPGLLTISVRDSGIGIEPAVLPKLFDLFEQGMTQKPQCMGGLGLGLAICKGVVELHGGSIQATSDGPGCGATFTVELETCTPPAVLPSCPSCCASPELPVKNGNHSEAQNPIRLLVVEDHSPTAELMARLLRRAGYGVTLAHSVAEAKELARCNRFALVLSDIGLPDGTGRDLMTHLREHYQLRGIALSGFGTDADARASLAAGFVEHVVKPVEWNQLAAALNRVLVG
ncbi:MAG: ATP-binding protein [Verrucomicrobia bacterium]|nr:ATP-binding protein [Verrucomicrobiota bacterium]